MDKREFPIHVLYRIDNIDYKIEYLNNFSLTTETMKFNNSNETISTENNYIVFVQNKNNYKLVVNFYSIPNGTLVKKYKFSTYNEFFNLLKAYTGNLFIFYKNVRREMLYQRENNSYIYSNLSNYVLYCLDTYLKYQLCLPLYVQGKISKRFRIPTVNEYLEKRQMKPIQPQKSDYGLNRLFFSYLVPEFSDLIQKYHGINRLSNISKNDLLEFIDYLILLGFEKTHIVIISSIKKRVERIENIDNLLLEQYFKYITNYKRDYQVLLLDGIPDTFKNIPYTYILS